MTRCVHAVLQILGCSLLFAISAPAAASCNAVDGWVGYGVGNPVRAELAALPDGQATGRQRVRYLVRLSGECLLANDLATVGSMMVGFSNRVLLSDGACKPAIDGKEIVLFYGLVPRGERLRLNALRRAKAKIYAHDRPMAFGLKRPLTVTADADAVLGVDIDQEPGECPLSYTGPFERPGENHGGSYIQLVDFEYLDDGDNARRHRFDCDRNGTEDVVDGFAFRVDNEEIQSNCRFTFRDESFEWLIRAGGTLSARREAELEVKTGTPYDLTKRDRRPKGLEPPRPISAPPPRYTDVARHAGIQGIVVARAVIDPHGDVEVVEVLKELPHGLTEAAVAAMNRWKFEPATLGGRPVAVYYILTTRFRLQRRLH